MTGKVINTVAQPAKFLGDHRTVAQQAQMQVPDDPEAVIARNTVKTVQTGQVEETTPKDADQYRKCGMC